MQDDRIVQIILLCWLIGCCSHPLFGKGLTLKVGDKPPALNCSLLDPNGGAPSSWDSLKGKVVILDFWATWCQPCIQSIPRLDSLVDEFKNEPVEFYSITYEPDSIVKPFLEKHRMTTRVCLDNDFTTFRSFKAWGIPMIVLVNKAGKIAGVIHPNKLTGSVIRAMLSGKIPKVEQSKGWPDPEGAEKYFRSTVSPKK